MTDENRQVTDRISYDPYGSITSRTGGTQTLFLYNGQYGVQTEENGLLYMRARYYSVELNRFVNADPVRDGLNWYVYGDNNPVNRIDPMGTSSLPTWDQFKQSWTDFATGVGPALREQVNAYGEYKDARSKMTGGLWDIGEMIAGNFIDPNVLRITDFLLHSEMVATKGRGLEYLYNPTAFALLDFLTLGTPSMVKGVILPDDYYGSPGNAFDFIGTLSMLWPAARNITSAVKVARPKISIQSLKIGVKNVGSSFGREIGPAIKRVLGTKRKGAITLEPIPLPFKRIAKVSPGVVQSRINISKEWTRFSPSKDAGLNHVIKRHFNPAVNAGQFNISVDALKEILARRDVIKTPVVYIPTSGAWYRIVDIGRVIGTVKPSLGGQQTTLIKIITDIKGNLITSYPIPAPK